MENNKPILIYRFHYTIWDKLEGEHGKWRHESGFVAGYSMADAIAHLENMTTRPEAIRSDIESIDSFYEVDTFDEGVLYDDTIQETFDGEAHEKKKEV